MPLINNDVNCDSKKNEMMYFNEMMSLNRPEFHLSLIQKRVCFAGAEWASHVTSPIPSFTGRALKVHIVFFLLLFFPFCLLEM